MVRELNWPQHQFHLLVRFGLKGVKVALYQPLWHTGGHSDSLSPLRQHRELQEEMRVNKLVSMLTPAAISTEHSGYHNKYVFQLSYLNFGCAFKLTNCQ